jgi:predicted Zn finger-like uncharacterized protein
MSLITQCPACATMFKVVPDQLRISDGWVRCGQCDEVFDANANLHGQVDVVQLDGADIAPEPELRAQAAPTSPDPDWAASLRFASDDPVTVEGSPAPEPPAPESPATLAPEPPALDVAMDDFLAQSPGDLSRPVGFDAETPPLESDDRAPLAHLGSPAPRYTQIEQPAAAASPLSFMQAKAGSAWWERAPAKWMLGGICALLLGGLLLQHAYTDRDRIAAYQPDMAPALTVMCEWLGCSISPLQAIESVVIDSSSFSKLRNDVYRLNVTIKNNSTVAVAPPSLELTLTDLQDQSMIRRVLGPADIGLRNKTLKPGEEFAVSLPLVVKPSAPTERVSGYRLLAFYP